MSSSFDADQLAAVEGKLTDSSQEAQHGTSLTYLAPAHGAVTDVYWAL